MESIISRIIGLYEGKHIAEAFNISEIARRTGAAYPHVHAAIKAMRKQGLLLIRTVGKSKYCTLNLESDEARNLAAHAHLKKKKAALSRGNLKNFDTDVKQLAAKEPSILSAIFLDGKLLLIVADKSRVRHILKQTAIPSISFLTLSELTDGLLSSLSILDGVALFGIDRLLLTTQPIQEQLMLNHSALFREVGQ